MRDVPISEAIPDETVLEMQAAVVAYFEWWNAECGDDPEYALIYARASRVYSELERLYAETDRQQAELARIRERARDILERNGLIEGTAMYNLTKDLASDTFTDKEDA